MVFSTNLAFLDFYPRPPRGGRRLWDRLRQLRIIISIHALREEGDFDALAAKLAALEFLSTPSARRATSTATSLRRCSLFLSTPSARRATKMVFSTNLAFLDFYPRPPRGGRLTMIKKRTSILNISIHALREEGDHSHRRCCRAGLGYFYPRPPRGGRPIHVASAWASDEISIHALREEGDPPGDSCHACPTQYFYPRPPRGGRPALWVSTVDTGSISIHALREEGDMNNNTRDIIENQFLSTPSARRATLINCCEEWLLHDFYPRPPRGGRPK